VWVEVKESVIAKLHFSITRPSNTALAQRTRMPPETLLENSPWEPIGNSLRHRFYNWCDTSGVRTLKYNHCTPFKLKRKMWEINSKRRGQIKVKVYKRN